VNTRNCAQRITAALCCELSQIFAAHDGRSARNAIESTRRATDYIDARRNERLTFLCTWWP